MYVEQSFDEKTLALGTKPPSINGSTRSTLNATTQEPTALPLCSACAAANPMMSQIILNNERIQTQLTALKDILNGTDLACNNLTQTADRSTLNKISGDAAHTTGDEIPNASVCIVCATKKALPAVASLAQGMKSAWKEQTANMSKAEKKALKGEVKAQAREMKKEFKMAKKLAKKERKCAE